MTFMCRMVCIKLASILSLLAFTNLVFAENQVETNSDDSSVLDEVTVTTTRSERGSKDVPAAVSVVGKEKIEKSRMFNISDALRGTPGVLMNSHNGAYDARLIIRGAGLKASYGVREITILRDGIPITDPDSFTRMDLIDPQDVERIEVSKGPGNLYAAGSSGGAVHVISKSVFDHENQKIKLGGGSFDTKNLHARFSGDIAGHL